MQIYESTHTINTSREDVFKLLENDAFLIQQFKLLEDIHYSTTHHRKPGTKLRISVKILNKKYHLRNQITHYDEPHFIQMETKLKDAVIVHTLELLPDSKMSRVNINSTLTNPGDRVKSLIRPLLPLVNFALNRSVKSFLKKIETYDS